MASGTAELLLRGLYLVGFFTLLNITLCFGSLYLYQFTSKIIHKVFGPSYAALVEFIGFHLVLFPRLFAHITYVSFKAILPLSVKLSTWSQEWCRFDHGCGIHAAVLMVIIHGVASVCGVGWQDHDQMRTRTSIVAQTFVYYTAGLAFLFCYYAEHRPTRISGA